MTKQIIGNMIRLRKVKLRLTFLTSLIFLCCIGNITHQFQNSCHFISIYYLTLLVSYQIDVMIYSTGLTGSIVQILINVTEFRSLYCHPIMLSTAKARYVCLLFKNLRNYPTKQYWKI